MKVLKKIVAVSAVFISAAVVFIILGYFAIFQLHFAIIRTEPDSSGWVLTNERYEIRPQTENREIGFEVIEKESVKTVYTTGESRYRKWDFKSI